MNHAARDVTAASGRPFTEAEAAACGLWVDPAHELMARFLGRAPRS